jgi:hypothetical protein
MPSIFTPDGGVAVSDELMQLVTRAFEVHGQSVEIPAAVVRDACGDLSSKTTDQILEIRKRERAVSNQTLGLRFA